MHQPLYFCRGTFCVNRVRANTFCDACQKHEDKLTGFSQPSLEPAWCSVSERAAVALMKEYAA